MHRYLLFAVICVYALIAATTTTTTTLSVGPHQMSCGLEKIDAADGPFEIPAVREDAQLFNIVWEHTTFGRVSRLYVDPTPHAPYLSHSFSTRGFYYLSTSNITQDFGREQGTRQMRRNVAFQYSDGTFSNYTLLLPMVDVVPPQFSAAVSDMAIPADWPPSRPILNVGGGSLTVSDGSAEWGTGNITVFSSDPSIFEVTAEQMEGPLPESIYRLNLYRAPKAHFTPGMEVNVVLVAVDTRNAGMTRLHLNIL